MINKVRSKEVDIEKYADFEPEKVLADGSILGAKDLGYGMFETFVANKNTPQHKLLSEKLNNKQKISEPVFEDLDEDWQMEDEPGLQSEPVKNKEVVPVFESDTKIQQHSEPAPVILNFPCKPAPVILDLLDENWEKPDPVKFEKISVCENLQKTFDQTVLKPVETIEIIDSDEEVPFRTPDIKPAKNR